MKRIHSFSGGVGSFSAALRDVKKNGVEGMTLLFTDTLIEDKDLYRFLVESAALIFGLRKPESLLELCQSLAGVERMETRKEQLSNIRKLSKREIPGLIWLSDGREPWEVFHDARWIGNSRIAQCSHELKQKPARKWVKEWCEPGDTVIYVGIDWTESHRMKGITKGWAPYRVCAPMTEPPYSDKFEMMATLKELGVEKPRLYDLGFSHNNCGGFCVRAGQGHFVNLLQKNRELYLFHEQKEEEMRQYLGREDVSILTRTNKGEDQTFTLRQLREEWDSGKGQQLDLFDIGGCGCFVEGMSE